MHVIVAGAVKGALASAAHRSICVNSHNFSSLSGHTILVVPWDHRRKVYDWWFEEDRRDSHKHGDIVDFHG